MRFIRGVIRSIVAFAFSVFCIFCFLYVIPITEKADPNGMTRDASWMSRLPDGKRLNEITLAGTHSSASKFVQLPYFFKCQDLEIRKQLLGGFRFLDIGIGIEQGETGARMKLMNGFADCLMEALPNSEKRYLEYVLTECYAFLEENPTETILFAVSQQSGKDNPQAVGRLLYSYILQRPEKWLLTDTIPTLGECRGKLVLMRRYADAAGLGPAGGISLKWDEQKGRESSVLNTAAADNGTYRLNVQDRQGYSDEDKWQAFVNGMAIGGRDIPSGAVSLNFLSSRGQFFFGNPYQHAAKLNGYFRNRLEKNDIRGWIVFDFGEPYLAREVYLANHDLSDEPLMFPVPNENEGTENAGASP